MMNFDCDCSCSQFNDQAVSNIISLLRDENTLNHEIKAGIARILNTILRNNNDNIHKRPNYLRMYG